MGVETIVVCDECEEYADLDKVPFSRYWHDTNTTEWFKHRNYRYQTMKLISFMASHAGHDVTMIDSVSEHQHKFFRVRNSSYGYEEFDLKRNFSSLSSCKENEPTPSQ